MFVFLGEVEHSVEETEELTERMLEHLRGMFHTTSNLMLVDVVQAQQR